jgi:predicted metal-dependent peptidase
MTTETLDAGMEKKSLQKMTSGRAKIIFRKSLYAPLLFRLVMKPVKHINTMATDGISLMFNAAFVIGLSMEHLMFSILHEVLHCVFHHPARRGTRDPILWNVATDLLVNAILVFDEGLPHPEWILLDKKYWKKPDGSFWTAEEIYDELAKDAEASKRRYKVQCPCIQRDPSASGTSGGAGQDQEPDGDMPDYTPIDPRGWIDVPWTKDTAETWKQAAIQTEQMARMRGTVPCWISSLVEELVEPPVPIERIFQHIAGSVASDEMSWKRLDRRFISRGTRIPSTLKDRKDVVFIGDTSGSISDDELTDFFGLMLRAFRSKGVNSIRVMQCDMMIVDDKVCRDAKDFKVHIRKTGGKGRGGTSFVPPFERLRNEKADWKVSCVVYATDLEGDFPKWKPRYPVFWISTTKRKAPFGTTYYWDRKTNKVERVTK